jgi:hypothetical protein
VSQPDNRDCFTVRAEFEDGVDTTAVSQQLQEAVQSVCRVRVDVVEPVPVGTITAETPGMVDERQWN